MKEKEIPEFGVKRDNEERRDGGCGIVFNPKNRKFAVGKQHDNGVYRLFSGGVDEKEGIEEGILREVVEESGLYNFKYVEIISQAYTHYFNSLKNVNRVALATCILIILESDDLKPLKLEEHEKFSLVWVDEEEIISNWKMNNANKDYDHWIYFMEIAIRRIKELGY